jgi:glutamine---fructose-6-phosphate transaminase (isomerizing)
MSSVGDPGEESHVFDIPVQGVKVGPVSSLFETEIREQPDALLRLFREGRPGAEAIAATVGKYSPRFVMVAARGSSDNAARYAQYLFGVRNQLAVALAAPSLFTHYDAVPALPGALVIGISQSGQSPDIVEVLRQARRQGALTLAITNDPKAPLAEVAEHCLPLLVGKERAVAATKTYTTQLLALAMLSAALRGEESGWTEIAALPEKVEATIALNSGLVPLARALSEGSRLVVVGRGFNLCTAFEIALKIKETSYVMAEPYSSADFEHGPIAILDETLPLFLVAPSGGPAAELDAFAERARSTRAPLIVLSDRPERRAGAQAALALPEGVPEWLSPVTAIVAGQLWALALTTARGLDPDAPRGLSKVTLTR